MDCLHWNIKRKGSWHFMRFLSISAHKLHGAGSWRINLKFGGNYLSQHQVCHGQWKHHLPHEDAQIDQQADSPWLTKFQMPSKRSNELLSIVYCPQQRQWIIKSLQVQLHELLLWVQEADSLKIQHSNIQTVGL